MRRDYRPGFYQDEEIREGLFHWYTALMRENTQYGICLYPFRRNGRCLPGNRKVGGPFRKTGIQLLLFCRQARSSIQTIISCTVICTITSPLVMTSLFFFEAYKMQHSLISPSTARMRINVAGKIQGIEIHAGGMIFFRY